MFEILLGVLAFGLGLWLAWSAGVEHGEARMLKPPVRSDASNLARERALQSHGWEQFRKQAFALEQNGAESPLIPSDKLAAVIGPEPITAAGAYRKVLAYAEANSLPMGFDGFMGFDGPMRLAFVAPQGNAAGLAVLIKEQLSDPVQHERSPKESTDLKWGDGPLGSVLRDGEGQLLARLRLFADDGVMAQLCNGMVWDTTDEVREEQDQISRVFANIEEAKAGVESALAGKGQGKVR